MKDEKLTYEEVLVVDKILDNNKWDFFELKESPKTGRQYFYDYTDGVDRLDVVSGIKEIWQGSLRGFDWAMEFGLTPEEIDTWDGMVERLGLPEKYKADEYKEHEVLGLGESRKFNERTTYFNTAEMESAIFAALNKMGGVISVDRTVHGYIVTTQDKDFEVKVDIHELVD